MEVRSDPNQPSCGTLVAALGFASSAWRFVEPGCFHRLDGATTMSNLRYVVSNSRFLILPWNQMPEYRLKHPWAE